MKQRLPLILPLALAAAALPLAIGQKDAPGKNAEKIEPALPAKPLAEPKQERKLLVFSRTNGFRHGSIPTGKTAITLLGEKTGAWEAVVSDDLTNFESDKINQFDAILFLNTTGDPFIDKSLSQDEAQAKSQRLQQNLQDFVKRGKGFAGIHSATDTLKPRGEFTPEYSKMIGGAFDGHPWGSGSQVSIMVEPGQEDHPVVKHLEGESMDFKEEIYQLRDPYDSSAVQMLLRLDLEKSEKKNLKRTDRDYGVSWVRKWGEGRVFYCSLGHNDAMYWHPEVLKVYLGGIQYALGDLEAPSK